MRFTKMEGVGNDYIYVDLFEETVANPASLARALSDRHFGVGGDGLILLAPSERADVSMQMFNADGSRAEMCGNGIRCLAKLAYDRGRCTKPKMTIETDAGIREVELRFSGDHVVGARTNMGAPVLDPERIPARFAGPRVIEQPVEADGRTFQVTCVSMGNPHVVVYVEDVERVDVARWGAAIEKLSVFPQRANVEFVQVLDERSVEQRTWERGSGETLACGTGACAVCVAGVLTNRTGPRLTSRLLGGELLLEWDGRGPVFMTGPAEEVFRGEWEHHGV